MKIQTLQFLSFSLKHKQTRRREGMRTEVKETATKQHVRENIIEVISSYQLHF